MGKVTLHVVTKNDQKVGLCFSLVDSLTFKVDLGSVQTEKELHCDKTCGLNPKALFFEGKTPLPQLTLWQE